MNGVCALFKEEGGVYLPDTLGDLNYLSKLGKRDGSSLQDTSGRNIV